MIIDLDTINNDMKCVIDHIPKINKEIAKLSETPIELNMDCDPLIIDNLSNIKEKLESEFGDTFKHKCNLTIRGTNKS